MGVPLTLDKTLPHRAIPSREEENAVMEMFGRKDYPSVERLARSLTARFPEDGFGWKALGVALKHQGQIEPSLAPMEKAATLFPKDPTTHNNLGAVLWELGLPKEAETAFRKAIKIKPDYAEAHFNLGNALMSLHRPSEAATACRRALAIRPEYANAHYGLANALKEQGLFDEAEASYRRALSIAPDHLNARGGFLFCINTAAHLSPQHRLDEALKYGSFATQSVVGQLESGGCGSGRIFHPLRDVAHQSRASPLLQARPARLRVGLVSGDLRQHPVGYFLESLLAHLDYRSVEVVAYATQAAQDDLSQRLKRHCSGWHSLVEMSDLAAARKIHQDGIHVLIDLAGHTAGNRLPVFAWRPAPIQVSWLGYFATTGLAEMDYLLADEVGVLPEHRCHFSETVWVLPDTRLCFTPPETAPTPSALPALSRGVLTFGSFQVLPKLNDEVLKTWGKILGAHPRSRLRLQVDSAADPVVKKALKQRLTRCGIDPASVEIVPSMPREAYLAAHAEIDMILDTFPYPGGTTTCEALWMGVPTLTLAGDSLLARQGASLLTAAGLRDWVATTREEYVDKAISWAGDLPTLAALRERLRDQVRHSPLCDAPRFARNLEAALWGMWEMREMREKQRSGA